MKFDRINNFKNGVKWGILYKFISILVPFIIQMIMIRNLGSEYVGVKSLFGSIISIISLSELGIGNAIIFCMYKPLSNNDVETVCNLLNFFKKAYFKIACFIFAVGLLAIPFFSIIIRDDCPKELNIYVVYLLILINASVSYLFGAYKNCILFASQRADIINICGIFVDSLFAVLQVVFLYVFKNYYLFLSTIILNTVFKNIVIALFSRKIYPMYNNYGKIDTALYKVVIEKIKGSFISNVCGVTRNTFDSIFISAFVGLTAVTVYGSYYFVITSISAFLAVFLSTLIPIIGNCVVENNKKVIFGYMIDINNLYMMLTCWITSCLILFYQPFVEFWIGENLALDYRTMILFPIYFYVGKMGDVRGVFSDAIGLFWENRFRTIIEAVTNIILNYILAKRYGIWGIVIATIITLFFIGFGGSTIVIFKHYFKSGMKTYLLVQLKFLLFMLVIGLCCMQINFYLDDFSVVYEIFCKCLVAVIFVPFSIIIFIITDKSLLSSLNWLKKYVHKISM